MTLSDIYRITPTLPIMEYLESYSRNYCFKMIYSLESFLILRLVNTFLFSFEKYTTVYIV